jgi:hypothetical protein
VGIADRLLFSGFFAKSESVGSALEIGIGAIEEKQTK